MTDRPKLIRTPREWIEQCRSCGGSGHIQKRESFALWTPDEWAANMPGFPREPLDPKFDVPPDAYVCEPVGGCSIFEACKEAVTIAREVGLAVAFEFNGAVAIVRADSDPIAVAKAWWKRAYGETYEEAMARR